MKHEERKKPCTTCGDRKMGATAASSYDILINIGVPPAQAAFIVELGIRATEDTEPQAVLVLALAASAERYEAAVQSLKEGQVELEKVEEELDETIDKYNSLLEACEGMHSPVEFRGEEPEDEEDDEEERDF